MKDLTFDQPQLLLHHDEDAEVYINGRPVAKLEGYTSSYLRMTLDEEAKDGLKAGTNCLAIHCRQSEGGQYIDAGLVDFREQSDK